MAARKEGNGIENKKIARMTDKANMLLIVVDSLRAAAPGCYRKKGLLGNYGILI